MGKVYFVNAEPIDLAAISVMGVSVKTGDSPVGYFGTGLKFAIATALRTGHTVTLVRQGEEIRFTSRPETIRGEVFEVVYMGEERLGFTTKLGRNWQPWHAYRELSCNCTDEGGVISDRMPEGEFGTVFIVEGDGIAGAHRSRHETFLSSEPIARGPQCEIHSGGGNSAFYRGVKAHTMPRPSLFSYNILDEMELTEDRTIKYGFYVECLAENAIAKLRDEEVIRKAVLAPEWSFEAGLDYQHVRVEPSEEFMNTVAQLRSDVHACRGAVHLWQRFADASSRFIESTLDEYDEEQFEKAAALCLRLGAEIQRDEVTFVENMGDGIFGTVLNGRIVIARGSLDMGHRFLASTLYEEWLHAKHGVRDEGRGMQNLLFEKLFATVERLCALERARNLSPEPIEA